MNTTESTAPAEPTGISFRETMSGGFALGATDPQVGQEQGDDARTRLSLHATITIDDLDTFIKDREHPGHITGSVDFPPLGMGLQSTSGVFNLFSPTSDPTTKYMVYEMGFRSGGQDYYLAGHKNVRSNHGLEFWRDTTTLYTTLHSGTDKSGPVAGAGILSLGLNELRKMIGTFEVLNSASAAHSAEALAKFGKFFLGEMWETYVLHR
jgi:cholesterol oxidase